jgi:ADP-ribose pyrophosphatase YjhB (NUDIX family)
MKKHSEKYDSARPFIACFVLLQKENKIAMVLRKNTGWMDGYYGLPAGKVEYSEPYAVGAVREAKEEAGVDIDLKDMRFVHIAHRHGENEEEIMEWVDVYFEADKWAGEPFNAEEDKSERLDWLDLNNLPENIVPPQRDALLHIAKGEFYSEYGWE